MFISITSSWQKILQSEFEKSYFQKLLQDVHLEYESATCFPPKELIFSAFNHCTFEKLKVVIIGQDPYHGINQANGLSFSVNSNQKLPPSLKNIFIELKENVYV